MGLVHLARQAPVRRDPGLYIARIHGLGARRRVSSVRSVPDRTGAVVAAVLVLAGVVIFCVSLPVR